MILGGFNAECNIIRTVEWRTGATAFEKPGFLDASGSVENAGRRRNSGTWRETKVSAGSTDMLLLIKKAQ